MKRGDVAFIKMYDQAGIWHVVFYEVKGPGTGVGDVFMFCGVRARAENAWAGSIVPTCLRCIAMDAHSGRKRLQTERPSDR